MDGIYWFFLFQAEVDSGGILVQETVPVLPGDTIPMLQERIKRKEHYAFPKALELVARGKVSVDEKGQVKWNY